MKTYNQEIYARVCSEIWATKTGVDRFNTRCWQYCVTQGEYDALNSEWADRYHQGRAELSNLRKIFGVWLVVVPNEKLSVPSANPDYPVSG